MPPGLCARIWPVTERPELDLTRQARAKQYARHRRRAYFLGLSLSGAVALVFLAAGLSTSLKLWLTGFQLNGWLLVAAFGALFYLPFLAVGLPIDYYSGFVLPHRFGQSTQTLGGWIKDQAISLTITAALGLPLLVGLYWLLRVAGGSWWLWAAAGYIMVAVVLANLAPVVLMPLFNKYTPLGDDHAELARRLTALAERAGTRVSGVFRFDMSRRTRSANAALTGLGNTRRIILGDTLLDEFSADEVETVLAHELGHHVHRDIPLIILVSGGIALGGLYLASLVMDWGVAAWGFEGPADVAGLPLLGLTLGLFGLITTPLNNAFLRWRERLADRYAVKATGKAAAFASALTRLANQNLADADPEPWVVFLLYSHPPPRERIAAAQRQATAR